MVPKITTIETLFSLTIKQLRSTAIIGSRRPTQGVWGVSPPMNWLCVSTSN